MALLKFLKGSYANLGNAAISEGQILICGDTGEMFVDVASDKRVKIGDYQIVANLDALPEASSVPTTRLYYIENGNILARSTGTEWIQINKQPTAEEMKTLLGLGSLAYLSEVAESNLNSDLAAKINAASGAQHTHDNKDVIDGITAEKVADWDDAVAKEHEHANKALLDTYTQTEENLADAVAKKHSHTFVDSDVEDAIAKKHAHTFNETELNKIVEGDVAKWNAVAADYLDSEDETALKNLIKEAKQAGTDANTNIETYKVTNDARVLAVEEDIAEIVDGTDGILAQAKSYSDNKLSAARTEISAEIDADVKVVADELAGYKSSNDTALAGVKATAEAAATKVYVDEELAKKVDKTAYEADKATFATKTELGDVDAKFASYRTSADQDVIDNGHKERIEALEAKFTGDDSVDAKIAAAVAAEAEIARAAEKANADDIDALEGRMDTAEGKIADLEAASATHATKDELNGVDAKFANYKTAADQKAIDDEQDRRLGVIEGDYLKAADIANFETKANVKKVADDLAAYVESNDAAVADRYTKSEADAKFALIADAYDDTALSNRVKAIEDDYLKAEHKTALEGLISAEQQRAEGIEGGLRTDVDAIKADYLKASDKTELEGKITAEENRAKGVEESLQTQINTIMNNPDTEGVINSINEFTQYISDHGEIAEGFRVDIDKNKEDIAAHAGRLDAVEAEMESHVHSWNDLEDKPFGEEGSAPITFNGDLEGYEYIDLTQVYGMPYYLVRVSEETFVEDQLVGGTIGCVGYDCDEYVISGCDDSYAPVYSMPIAYNNLKIFREGIYIIRDAAAMSSDGIEVPGNGTYFVYVETPDGTAYATSLTLPGGSIKTLDDKYISSNIARTADVTALDGRVQALEAIDHEAYKGYADGLNSAMDARVGALEAIDHEAYVAADEAVKTELSEAIATAKDEAIAAASNQDAVILAEAQRGIDALAQTVADNAATAGDAIAELEEKVYTKDEVNALLEAQSSWGEF